MYPKRSNSEHAGVAELLHFSPPSNSRRATNTPKWHVKKSDRCHIFARNVARCCFFSTRVAAGLDVTCRDPFVRLHVALQNVFHGAHDALECTAIERQ